MSLSPQVKLYNRNFFQRQQHHAQFYHYHDQLRKANANKKKMSPQSYTIVRKQMECVLASMILNEANKSKLGEYRITVPNISASNSNETNKQLETTQLYFQNSLPVLANLLVLAQPPSDPQQHLFSQIWLLAAAYENISPTLPCMVLYELMLVLMDPYFLSPNEIIQVLSTVCRYQHLESKRKHFIESMPQLAAQTMEIRDLLAAWNNLRAQAACSSLSKKKLTGRMEAHQLEKGIQHYGSLSQLSGIGGVSVETNSCCSHSPSLISHKSRQLAERSLQKYLALRKTEEPENQLSQYMKKVPYHQLLYERGLQSHKGVKGEQVNQQGDQNTSEGVKTGQNLEKKVLTPLQTQNMIANLYTVKPRQQDTDFKARDEERQLKQCTFEPQLIKRKKNPKQNETKKDNQTSSYSEIYGFASRKRTQSMCQQTKDIFGKWKHPHIVSAYSSNNQNSQVNIDPQLANQDGKETFPLNYHKEVSRLQHARQSHLRRQSKLETMGHVSRTRLSSNKSGHQTSRNIHRQSNPPSFLERDRTKLIMQVEISPTHIEKIELRGCEEPKVVAWKFVKKHGLDEEMVHVLEHLIEQNLKGLDNNESQCMADM